MTVAQPSGWTIVTLPAPEYTMWSFAPQGHEAYPAVVRRVVKQRGGGVYVDMTVLCEAGKEACDRLVREFQKLNQQMREDVRARTQGAAQP